MDQQIVTKVKLSGLHCQACQKLTAKRIQQIPDVVDFQVSGMHCQSCEMLIKEEILALQDIAEVQIDHKSGLGSVKFANGSADSQGILAAIEKAGYKGTLITPKTNGFSKQERLTLNSFQVELPKEIGIE